MKKYTFALTSDQDFSYLSSMLDKAQSVSLDAINKYESVFAENGKHQSLYKMIKSDVNSGYFQCDNKFFIFIHAYEYITGKNTSIDSLASVTFLKRLKVDDDTIRFINQKSAYKFEKNCNIKGRILSITLGRQGNGYFVEIITDAEYCWKRKETQERIVGLDWGLKHFYIGSDFSTYDSSHFYTERKPELQKIQKMRLDLDRNSKEYQELNKEYDRICTDYIAKRTDWQYWSANQLCLKYDYIFLETLDYGSIAKDKRRRESIRNYGMKGFLAALMETSKMYGTTVHKIDMFFPSSQLCPCGYRKTKLGERTRAWTCPECRFRHDRDVNAAQNIARKGIYELGLEDKFFDYLFNLYEDYDKRSDVCRDIW